MDCPGGAADELMTAAIDDSESKEIGLSGGEDPHTMMVNRYTADSGPKPILFSSQVRGIEVLNWQLGPGCIQLVSGNQIPGIQNLTLIKL